MFKTVLLLVFTLVVLPAMVVLHGQPLAPEQWHMLTTGSYMMLGVAALCFLLGELTGNCSQVDKLWSLLPVAYSWYFVGAAGFEPRMLLMAVLVTVWGARLTYNFSRKGGYIWRFWLGEEDYRWNVLRQNPLLKGRLRWGLFNLFFISLYQNVLIFMFTLPMVAAWQGRGKPLGWQDALLAAVFLALVVVETLADQQQWDFQTEKYRRIQAGQPLGEPYQQGFVQTGLWAKVRHPNFAAEQGIWLVFYLFAVAATGNWINWSMAGCLLLLLLFQGSSDFTEKISASKYPAYKDYQKRVPRFLPRVW